MTFIGTEVFAEGNLTKRWQPLERTGKEQRPHGESKLLSGGGGGTKGARTHALTDRFPLWIGRRDGLRRGEDVRKFTDNSVMAQSEKRRMAGSRNT